MDIKDVIRLPDPRKEVKVEIREVVRDVGKKPHVFIRVRLSGWHFPQRALEPFLVIGKAVSRFVVLDPDGTAADAYFDVKPPAAERVSFGYGNIIAWDFDVRVDPARIDPLDRGGFRKDSSTLPADGRAIRLSGLPLSCEERRSYHDDEGIASRLLRAAAASGEAPTRCQRMSGRKKRLGEGSLVP
jgi:hypothetical protein